MKLLSFISLAFAACAMLTANAHAVEAPHSKTKASAKTAKPAAAPASKESDEPEPDIQQHNSFEYKCELGNSLTMYINPEDTEHVAMRWKKRLYRLSKIETTTGAVRFENRKSGLIWIGIPAKGLLLDSLKGQQLANECKTATPALAEVDSTKAAPTLIK
ncbi:hypothetical protein H8L32_01935 [Undibacterium sp. CY18W]|uniref:Membrane-bound lysozyme-inhibitor of c-type lysozyme n=1 Tax=Undibacterium hunanense TaxID=2762292 RepID=A0ABR6ZK16_9BURK|nr:hypothetical protein [Undibacterium hunanense]MBC3916235.1 hypothetical protein [Undibacterium hunanense]